MPLNPSHYRLALIAFQINTALIPSCREKTQWFYCVTMPLYFTSYLEQKGVEMEIFVPFWCFWFALYWFVGDLVSCSRGASLNACMSSAAGLCL